MHVRHLLVLAPLALALGACSDDDDYDFDSVAAARQIERENDIATGVVPPEVLFDPGAGVLPFPNDALFAGTEDGTLNIPGTDPTNFADPSVALNLSDGFSTIEPITTGVSAALDPATLIVGETVRVFELDSDADGVPSLGTELGPDRIAAVERGGTLALLPLAPLAPATTYAVYLTTGIANAGGLPLGSTTTFRLTAGATPLTTGPAAALEPLRQLTRPLIGLIGAQATPVAASDIALAWRFTTGGIREVLQSARDLAVASRLLVAPSGQSTAAAGLQGKADILVGALDLPYYLVAPEGPADVAAALDSFWRDANDNVVTRFSPTPVATSTQRVPVLMTVPNAESAVGATPPANGWPVMVFQHGITRNRTDMLAVADAMADAGFAVIAIDIPVHGLTDPANPFHAANNPLVDGERTFDIDVADNASGAPGPDGQIDDSGQYFVNLRNLANSRDNLRQAAADLMTLSQSLGSLQLVVGAEGQTAGGLVDASRKAFLGHSLGAIVGATFLSYDDSFQSATLAMPGGGIARFFAASPAFGPELEGGLQAAQGIVPGSADYQRFLVATQTVIDSGDPINHASFLGAAATPQIHLIEVTGTPEGSPPDQVIPNAVAGAPLSGTEPLARLLGLQPVVEDSAGSALVRFSRGNHGSIINPVDESDPEGAFAATVEMQTQSAIFAATGGQSIDITNTDVIAPLDVTIRPAMLPMPPAPGDVTDEQVTDETTDDMSDETTEMPAETTDDMMEETTDEMTEETTDAVALR